MQYDPSRVVGTAGTIQLAEFHTYEVCGWMGSLEILATVSHITFSLTIIKKRDVIMHVLLCMHIDRKTILLSANTMHHTVRMNWSCIHV